MAQWKEEVRKLAGEMTEVPQISRSEIPDIPLYMDQLVTYLDRRLGFFKRDEDGPLITNAMVNNYSKAKLVPPARSKRYGEDHVMALCLICQLKRMLPVQDMGKILRPGAGEEELAALYELFLQAQREAFSQAPKLAEEVIAAASEIPEDQEQRAPPPW